MRNLTIVALLSVLSASAEAQHARRGFWFGAGVGGGSTGSRCDTISRKLLLGGEISGWAISDVFGVDQSAGVALITLHWYPTGGFFLKGGVGGFGYRWDSGITESVDEGGAIGLGAGYDWRVADNFSIVPFINAYAAPDLKRTVNGVDTPVATRISRDLVQVGLGLTFH
jgi:hypothetical protein